GVMPVASETATSEDDDVGMLTADLVEGLAPLNQGKLVAADDPDIGDTADRFRQLKADVVGVENEGDSQMKGDGVAMRLQVLWDQGIGGSGMVAHPVAIPLHLVESVGGLLGGNLRSGAQTTGWKSGVEMDENQIGRRTNSQITPREPSAISYM